MTDIGKLVLRATVEDTGVKQFATDLVGMIPGVGQFADQIVGAAAKAIELAEAFGKVDSTMRLASATMGATGAEQEQMWSTMADAAKASVYSMEDASTAMLNFARAGLDASEASAALAPAMNLAAGEGGNLEIVSAGLTATINGFGDSFSNTSKYADVFAAACNNSALEVNALSSNMTKVAPAFKAAGYSVEDAATAMGIMANNGIDAERSSTALSNGLLRLTGHNKNVKNALADLNIELVNSDGSMKDFDEVLGLLRESFDGLTESQQLQYAADLFGQNNAKNWLPLITAEASAWDELSDSIEHSAGTADKMAETMMEGMGGKLEQLSSTVDVAKVSWGQFLSDGILPLMDPIINLIDFLGQVGEAAHKMVQAIGDAFKNNSAKATIEDLNKAYEENVKEAENNAVASKKAADRMFEAQKAFQSATKGTTEYKIAQERLQTAVATYNKVAGDNVTITNKETGELSKNTDEIYKNITARKMQAVQAALEEKYAGMYQEQAEKIQELVEVEQKLIEAEREKQELEANGLTGNGSADELAYYQNISDAVDRLTNQRDTLEAGIKELDTAQEGYNEELNKYLDAMVQSEVITEEEADALRNNSDALEANAEAANDAADATEGLTEEQQAAIEAHNELRDAALSTAEGMAQAGAEAANEKTNFNSVVTELLEGSRAAREYGDTMEKFASSFESSVGRLSPALQSSQAERDNFYNWLLETEKTTPGLIAHLQELYDTNPSAYTEEMKALSDAYFNFAAASESEKAAVDSVIKQWDESGNVVTDSANTQKEALDGLGNEYKEYNEEVTTNTTEAAEKVQQSMDDTSTALTEGETVVKTKTEDMASEWKKLADAIEKAGLGAKTQKQIQDMIKAFNDKYGEFAGAIDNYLNKLQELIDKAAAASSAASNAGGNGHKTGLAFTPYDGYHAILHYGERVLTRSENEQYTRNGANPLEPAAPSGNTYNFYIPESSDPMDTALAVRDILRDQEYSYS